MKKKRIRLLRDQKTSMGKLLMGATANLPEDEADHFIKRRWAEPFEVTRRPAKSPSDG
jgi:hypothetical protein